MNIILIILSIFILILLYAIYYIGSALSEHIQYSDNFIKELKDNYSKDMQILVNISILLRNNPGWRKNKDFERLYALTEKFVNLQVIHTPPEEIIEKNKEQDT